MCIIVSRAPGQEIDFETRFKSMVINNPHGYGIAIAEGDRLVVVKELAEEKPDPEAVYKLVQEELLDEQLMFHLRYTTAGETSLRNLHPFPVLEREADGVDLRMAHNGTIHKWKHPHTEVKYKWESDTRHFVREFVRPLFKRLIRGAGTDDLLTDPWVIDLLNRELPGASVLSFIDGTGHTLEVNPTGNGGFYENEGLIWFSNKYSFDELYRKPAVVNTGARVWRNNGWHDMEAWEDKYSGNAPTSGTGTFGVGSKPKANPVLAPDTQTELFSDKYSEVITSVTDLFLIKDDTLQIMKEEDPSDLVLLVKELLFKCNGMYNELSRKEDVDYVKTIEALKAQIKTKDACIDGQKATIQAFQTRFNKDNPLGGKANDKVA